MPSTVKKLAERQLLPGVPSFLPESIQLEVMTGSVAYGVSDDTSDMDIVGFCIPDKTTIFPHLKGEIKGFGKSEEGFHEWQQHHIKDPTALGGKGREYDFSIMSIVKFFNLCMQNNPNMIDVLFVPRRCVLYTTPIGELVRERRKMFLHKGSWYKFKGYAYQQQAKLEQKVPTQGKRKDNFDKYGYDTKYAYHIVRLLNEGEQILVEHDLDLEKNREQLKEIRNGEWTVEKIKKYAQDKELALEDMYLKSTLPYAPDEEAIKSLLMDCLEQHFGSLSGAVVRESGLVTALRQIDEIIYKVKMNGDLG